MCISKMDVDSEHEETTESGVVTGSEATVVAELSALIGQLSGENMREIAPQLLHRAADIHWDQMLVLCFVSHSSLLLFSVLIIQASVPLRSHTPIIYHTYCALLVVHAYCVNIKLTY